MRSGSAWCGTAIALVLCLGPRAAFGYGALFSSAAPVVETQASVLFRLDPATRQVDVLLDVSYQGDARDFVWLIPLRAAPTSIELGSSHAFTVADRLTAPRFELSSTKRVGICTTDPAPGRGPAPGPDPGFQQNETPDIVPLLRAQLGPYETTVLAGADAASIEQWLTRHQYPVSTAMMERVAPYVAEGDVLLALRLRGDQDTGDLQPLALSLPSDDLRLPLRLTAISAADDVALTAFFLSSSGRAIPDNVLHVVPNLARIDWLGRGANYRQVIAAAADEGGGNAFTTEYAGPAQIFAAQIFREGQIDLAPLRAATTVRAFVDEAERQGLADRVELPGILRRAIGAVALDEAVNVAPAGCLRCYADQLGARLLDAVSAAREIEERILVPERRAQQLFDTSGTLTRLLSVTSGPDMKIDPTFSFEEGLPEVPNLHSATLVLDCGLAGVPGSAGGRIELADGSTIELDAQGKADPLIATLPAAARVEQLKHHTVVKDNIPGIERGLDLQSAHSGGGCRCVVGDSQGPSVLAGALLVLLAFRRRTRAPGAPDRSSSSPRSENPR